MRVLLIVFFSTLLFSAIVRSSFRFKIPIPSGDAKLTISPAFWEDNNYQGYETPLIGRILIRDGQTLIQEGVPYDPKKHSCAYYSYSYMAFQMVTSQFCCIEFE